MAQWLSSHWLHLVLVFAYLAVLARHAWVASAHVNKLDDYLVAGRGLGGWVIALSFYATFMSTNTFIGAAGKSWDVGLSWCLGGFVLFGCCCASWLILAPRFVPLTREYQSLTVADFLGAHYGSKDLRRLAALIVSFASVIYLVAIYRGSALAVEQLLELPYFWSAVVIFLIVTAYTLAGGFESVVLTDALQGALMVAGAVGMLAALLWRAGGWAPAVEAVGAIDPALVAWRGETSYATIFALSLAVGIKYLVEPRQLSRMYGLRDASALRLATIVAPLLIGVTYVCLLPIGALSRAVIPADAIASTDEVVPFLLSGANLFGPLFGPAFLLVLAAAAMSSIDSVLLVAASTIDRDLLMNESTDRRAVRRARIWVVLVSLASLLVAISPFTRDIMTLTAFSGSLYGACFFPTLVMGLFWRRPSATAAYVSLVGGSIIVISWFAAKRAGWTDIHEVYAGMSAGIAIYAIAGLLLRPREAGRKGRSPS